MLFLFIRPYLRGNCEKNLKLYRQGKNDAIFFENEGLLSRTGLPSLKFVFEFEVSIMNT